MGWKGGGGGESKLLAMRHNVFLNYGSINP
uniref:Uncharacterized protein n=1 Tax=Anguilla anguilla TaxID=7936 RepID=A0A0E9QVM1_ANGAN